MRLHRLLLIAAETDKEASFQPARGPDPSTGRAEAAHWLGRCLHCRTRIGLDPSGKPWPGTTLEHIVPRSWFGKRAAAALTAGLSGPDDPRNLALACARCNHGKGKGPDARGPGDPAAFEVIGRLLARRLARWREAPDPHAHP